VSKSIIENISTIPITINISMFATKNPINGLACCLFNIASINFNLTFQNQSDQRVGGGMVHSPSNSSNGSRVAVEEVK
jgi:hypothetical protein